MESWLGVRVTQPNMTRQKLSDVVAQCEADWDSQEDATSSDDDADVVAPG